MEEEGAEHISTQDVEDAQLRATLAATRVDELRAQVVDRSRRHRAKRPRDVVGGAKKRKGKRNRNGQRVLCMHPMRMQRIWATDLRNWNVSGTHRADRANRKIE